MSTMRMRIGVGAALAALVLMVVPTAHAFFPLGFYDDNNVLQIVTWTRDDFDTDNDGLVEEGEGIEYIVQVGEDGFTEAEVEIIQEAFDVWSNVSTSFAAFRILATTRDPLEPADDDFFHMITLGDTTDDDYTPVYSETNDFVTAADGNQYWMGAGEIYDADIVLNPDDFRAFTADGEVNDAIVYDLKAELVYALGVILGLTDTPLNNVAPIIDPEDDSIIGYEEREVVQMTMPNGQVRFVGATPTMFVEDFTVRRTNGEVEDGRVDLAPDDISGISWLYPQGSQAAFFNFKQKARTFGQSASNTPTSMIIGGNIVAWADVDNDPSTRPIPLFSTITGLYKREEDTNNHNEFNLIHMWKQIPSPGVGGGLINVPYYFTVNELNGSGADRQAPEDVDPDTVDVIHGGGLDYTTGFISMVFNEVDDVLDIDNVSSGTALVWDYTKSTLVSRDTGRTISNITGGGPMFGDESNVCPLNVLEEGKSLAAAGLLSGADNFAGPNALRGFRDKVMLESAFGTAMADLYYRAAAPVAQYLSENAIAREWVRPVVHFGYAAILHPVRSLSALLGFAGVSLILLQMKRMRYRQSVTG